MCIGVYTIIKKPRVSPWFKAKPLPAKPKKNARKYVQMFPSLVHC